MRNISQEELNKILESHELWLRGEGGIQADLSNVDLSYSNLRCADLKDANLSNADLRGANLRCADLTHADLTYADLTYADLKYANLRYVDLKYANLSHADLRYTDLTHADLTYANLSHADLLRTNLKDIKTNIYTRGYNLVCPEKGSFIGYKKAHECIVKLLILEDAKRSSATTIKCRCSKAKVLDIRDIYTGKKVNEVNSNYDINFIYKVGEIVRVDNFDEDRWNECSNGINFFMNRENAIKY